jgi:anti-anti-sigma regulatory factor
MKPLFVEFYTSSPSGLRAQATAAVSDAIQRRSTILVVGLDSLARLDDAVISAIIVALRGLRAIGGTVRLVTQSVTHRRHLAAIGLDRVFDVFATAEEAA